MLAASSPRTSTRRPVGRCSLALLAGGGLVLAAVFGVAAASYIWPAESGLSPETAAVGNVEDFALGSVTLLRDFDVPGYLVRLESGEFLALHAAEPVNGCALVWGHRSDRAPERFFDPCRGFEYHITGQPSPDNTVRVPMHRLEVDIDRAGAISVTTPRSLE